jgi:hypothetical protein
LAELARNSGSPPLRPEHSELARSFFPQVFLKHAIFKGMRLVDFLVLILEAHAETLKRLAALFGEERFLELLENADGENDPAPTLDCKLIPFAPIGTRLPAGARSPYVELEGAVHEMHLPAFLEFHLWAYPHYRAFVESDLDLGSTMTEGNPDTGRALVDEAIRQAHEWVRKLHIPPAISAQAEAAAQAPWIRFRTNTLRKMGFRPIGPVA